MNRNAHHTGRDAFTLTELRGIPAGVIGTIAAVESHSIAPFTRYTVTFDDGTVVAGVDPAAVRVL